MGWIPHLVKRFAALALRHGGGRLPAPSAETIADPEVLRLFRRMEELKRLDDGFDIHGSWQHRYEYHRVSSADLMRVEAKLGYELPDQYRRWLVNVGRGAGPRYELLCRHNGEVFGLPEPEGPISPQLIRDVTELTPERLQELHAAKYNQPYLFCVWSDRGLTHLCAHGCGLGSYLIVAGPMKGHVVFNVNAAGWDMPDGADEAFVADEGAIPPAVLPTFFEWLECWIECSISQLPERRSLRIGRDRGRTNS